MSKTEHHETACCKVEIGTIVDNTELTANYSHLFASKEEAQAKLDSLTELAKNVSGGECEITSSFKDVDQGVQLEASFTFAVQAEMIIFQLKSR